MSTIEGQKLLFKLGDGEDPEVFSNVCGIQTSDMSFTTNTDDVVVFDCNDLDKPGVDESIVTSKSLEISGSGISDDATFSEFMDWFESGQSRNGRFNIPNSGDRQAKFQLRSLNYTGNVKGHSTFDISLKALGQIEKVV